MVLICKDCGFYDGIIPGTMREILAGFPGFFVNTEPTFLNSVGTD